MNDNEYKYNRDYRGNSRITQPIAQPLKTQHQAKHKEGENKWFGINLEESKIADMKALNVLMPKIVTEQALKAATEAACMILRVDDVIQASNLGGGPGGPGPGGMPDMDDY